MLCRIFHKSNIGPPSGQRYAPFIEEEWEDDESAVVPGINNGDEVAAVPGHNKSIGGNSRGTCADGNNHGTCIERNASDTYVEEDTVQQVCALLIFMWYNSMIFFFGLFQLVFGNNCDKTKWFINVHLNFHNG